VRVLGIDPGTYKVGYGIVETDRGRLRAGAFGILRPPERDPYPKRLLAIYRGLLDVIEREKPDEAALEEVFYGRSIKTALRMGEGRGVAILAAECARLPVAEYAATLVKKSVVGSGGAGKHQVKEMVRIILGLPKPPGEDAADALAIAICHCHRAGH
jgi:crossover junction endodeoxyribonuclease RuvC